MNPPTVVNSREAFGRASWLRPTETRKPEALVTQGGLGGHATQGVRAPPAVVRWAWRGMRPTPPGLENESKLRSGWRADDLGEAEPVGLIPWDDRGRGALLPGSAPAQGGECPACALVAGSVETAEYRGVQTAWTARC